LLPRPRGGEEAVRADAALIKERCHWSADERLAVRVPERNLAVPDISHPEFLPGPTLRECAIGARGGAVERGLPRIHSEEALVDVAPEGVEAVASVDHLELLPFPAVREGAVGLGGLVDERRLPWGHADEGPAQRVVHRDGRPGG